MSRSSVPPPGPTPTSWLCGKDCTSPSSRHSPRYPRQRGTDGRAELDYRHYALNRTTWADWLDVPRHTFSAVLGAVTATGLNNAETFQILRPGFDLAVQRQRREDAGVGEQIDDLRGATHLEPAGAVVHLVRRTASAPMVRDQNDRYEHAYHLCTYRPSLHGA